MLNVLQMCSGELGSIDLPHIYKSQVFNPKTLQIRVVFGRVLAHRMNDSSHEYIFKVYGKADIPSTELILRIHWKHTDTQLNGSHTNTRTHTDWHTYTHAHNGNEIATQCRQQKKECEWIGCMKLITIKIEDISELKRKRLATKRQNGTKTKQKINANSKKRFTKKEKTKYYFQKKKR